MSIFSFLKKDKTQSSISVGQTANYLGRKDYPALANSAFWACLADIVRTFGTMPWKLYKEGTPSKTEITDRNNPIKYLMNHPAPYLNGVEWRMIMAFNFEMFGQAMAIIRRRGATLTALLPVSPNLMVPYWVNNDTTLTWRYAPTGEVFADSELLRFTNLPTGYATVLDPSFYAREDIDVMQNEKKLQAAYYKNGATIGGILTVPKGTSKEYKEQLKAILASMYSGIENSHKSMVLEDNMKYEPIHLENGDITKMKEATSMSNQEVFNRFFGPDAGATYANAEQKGIEKVKALLPRFIVWETAFDELLPDGISNKFNLSGLMRADSATQMNVICTGINNGLYTINEGRALLDYPPVEGGDTIRVPLNYGTLEPDGTIKNPNTTQQTLNPFDLPLDTPPVEQPAEPQEQKESANKDQLFLEAVAQPAKTARNAIEAIMRKQVKSYIQTVNDLQGKGSAIGDLSSLFWGTVKGDNKTYGNEYTDIIKQVMNKLVPIIKTAVGSQKDLNQSALDAYSGSLGQSLASRFGGDCSKDLSGAKTAEDIAHILDLWLDRPTSEAEDATNRFSNASQVFLYGQLGLKYMHVVAAPDSCEFCQKLDGKVVEVNGAILKKGQEDEDGAGNIRIIKHDYKHPPFHTYCHCTVAPGEK